MGKHCQYVNSTILFAMLELNNDDDRLGQRYDLIVNSGIRASRLGSSLVFGCHRFFAKINSVL
jgi:hypothetical protein